MYDAMRKFNSVLTSGENILTNPLGINTLRIKEAMNKVAQRSMERAMIGISILDRIYKIEGGL